MGLATGLGAVSFREISKKQKLGKMFEDQTLSFSRGQTISASLLCLSPGAVHRLCVTIHIFKVYTKRTRRVEFSNICAEKAKFPFWGKHQDCLGQEERIGKLEWMHLPFKKGTTDYECGKMAWFAVERCVCNIYWILVFLKAAHGVRVYRLEVYLKPQVKMEKWKSEESPPWAVQVESTREPEPPGKNMPCLDNLVGIWEVRRDKVAVEKVQAPVRNGGSHCLLL